jgi:ParB family chromosome partitioning protein
MARSDDLLRRSGETLMASASVRPGPVGMASVASAVGGRDARKDGLDRSKASWKVPLEKIERDPGQPREEFSEGEIERLAESLKIHGLIQPITVIWNEESSMYRIVAGERRFRAARMAEWPGIDCVVIDRPLGPDEVLALQCVENLLRESLKPIEKAKAFRTLLTVNGWSVTRLAENMGISQSAVSQSLLMLELPEGVQARVDEGKLSAVSAYHLSKLDDPIVQAEVAERIITEGLSRDETVEVVRQVKASKPPKVSKGRGVGKVKAKLPTARTLRTPAGFKVTVEHRKGFDPAGLIAALEEALAKARAEQEGETAAA